MAAPTSTDLTPVTLPHTGMEEELQRANVLTIPVVESIREKMQAAYDMLHHPAFLAAKPELKELAITDLAKIISPPEEEPTSSQEEHLLAQFVLEQVLVTIKKTNQVFSEFLASLPQEAPLELVQCFGSSTIKELRQNLEESCPTHLEKLYQVYSDTDLHRQYLEEFYTEVT